MRHRTFKIRRTAVWSCAALHIARAGGSHIGHGSRISASAAKSGGKISFYCEKRNTLPPRWRTFQDLPRLMSFAFICKWELRLGYKTQASVTQGRGERGTKENVSQLDMKERYLLPLDSNPSPLHFCPPQHVAFTCLSRFLWAKLCSATLSSAPVHTFHTVVSSLRVPSCSSGVPPPAPPDLKRSKPLQGQRSRWVHVNCLQKWQLFPALTEALSIETRFQAKGRNLALVCCSLLSCESSWYLAGHSKKIS